MTCSLSTVIVVVIIYSATAVLIPPDMKTVSSAAGILTRKMMRAAIIPNIKNKFEIRNVEIPIPKADECLVKIVASGCCHTDLHAINGDWYVICDM